MAAVILRVGSGTVDRAAARWHSAADMDRPTRPVNAPSHRSPASRGAAQAFAGLALAGLLLLPGCSFFQAPQVQRGNRVTEEQLQEITPGVQTRKDVEALLGSPTQTSTFGDANWYYISAKTRQRPGRQLALSDQETVVVTFDQKGVVQEVKRLTGNDGQEVTMVTRETPTPGNDRTLLQALFGNIGRVGPGAVTQGSQGAGPGAQTPGALR
jgi:outer membrane protein assembly factor BamE (lipoprotein component of BamABCDE complex)